MASRQPQTGMSDSIRITSITITTAAVVANTTPSIRIIFTIIRTTHCQLITMLRHRVQRQHHHRQRCQCATEVLEWFMAIRRADDRSTITTTSTTTAAATRKISWTTITVCGIITDDRGGWHLNFTHRPSAKIYVNDDDSSYCQRSVKLELKERHNHYKKQLQQQQLSNNELKTTIIGANI